MSDEGIRRPARKLDEFEELVYEYTGRMGLGSEEVRQKQRITLRAGTFPLHISPYLKKRSRRTCKLTANSTGTSMPATATSASSPQPADPQPRSPSY
jgi:hypothetical protein